MNSAKRHKKLSEIIKRGKFSKQAELVDALFDIGVECNQATLSRDLKALGVHKIDGIYCLPNTQSSSSAVAGQFRIEPANGSLLVIRTQPGQGQAVAYRLDNFGHKGIVGTVAGDDTVFVALRYDDKQEQITKDILRELT